MSGGSFILPPPSLWRRLDAAARAAFPAASTALLLLLLAAPLGLPGQSALQPALLLASVFFWSLFRPAAMPPPVVFALGLLADLIADAPLGGGVLVLLLVLGVTRWTRRRLVRQSFLAVWLAFSALAALAALLGWTLAALLSLTFLPIAPAIIEAGLAIGFYPALATLLSRAHRGLAAPERA